MRTAAATVTPNWRKNLPAMPVVKATGRKTATMVMVVAVTARPTSDVPSLAACCGSWCQLLHVAEDVLPDDDGVVDEEADREAQGQQGDHVDRVAERGHDGEGGDDADGQAGHGDERVAQVAEGEEDDEPGEEDAEDQAVDDVVAGILDLGRTSPSSSGCPGRDWPP